MMKLAAETCGVQ